MGHPMLAETEEIRKIEPFKKGYAAFVDSQAAHARAAQQLIGSSVLVPDEKRALGDGLPQIDKLLVEIGNTSRQMQLQLSATSLHKEAQRDYHAFFKGDILEHQLSFVIFLKTYILLSKYSRSLIESWKTIRELVTGAKLSDNSEFRKQLLQFRVGPVLQDLESLRIFVQRMAVILNSTRDPITTREISALASYREDGVYQLSSVFSENLQRADNTTADWEHAGGAAVLSRSAAPPAPVVSVPEQNRLHAGGTQSWNQNAHYFFSYDPRQLEAERARLTNIVHIDMHMGADMDMVRSERILKYTRKLVQQEVHGNVEEEYKSFLLTFFNLVIEITCLNLTIPPKLRDLFLFHLGPQSFYYLTRKFLQELDTGTIHRRSGRAVMEKFVPAELLKKTLLEWWQSQILSAVGAQRDDQTQYRAILKLTKDTYDRLSAKAMAEYDALPEAAKAGRPRAEVVRENLNRWLGPTNIIVFRRFLKSDIQ
jgi:hypothetical protein